MSSAIFPGFASRYSHLDSYGRAAVCMPLLSIILWTAGDCGCPHSRHPHEETHVMFVNNNNNTEKEEEERCEWSCWSRQFTDASWAKDNAYDWMASQQHGAVSL